MSLLSKIFQSKQKNSQIAKKNKPAKSKIADPIDKPAAIGQAEKPPVIANVGSDVIEKKIEKKEDIGSYRWLRQPLITEKATDLTALNKYVFIVPVNAEKSFIKEKIRNIYGVKPIKINFIKKIGKKTRLGQVSGKKKNFKKAIVTLAAGHKLEIYEGV